jgi:glycine dehydrogenase
MPYIMVLKYYNSLNFKGLKEIAMKVHRYACAFADSVEKFGHKVKTDAFFDTLTVELTHNSDDLITFAEKMNINIRKVDVRTVAVSFNETTDKEDLVNLLYVFSRPSFNETFRQPGKTSDYNTTSEITAMIDSLTAKSRIPSDFLRKSSYLKHHVFNSYHSETEMLRYINKLQAKDLSLTHTMIPLGSCTMKLNATTEMIPVTWPHFSNIHPFAPESQATGYRHLLQELEFYLAEITGFHAVSLQPNSGAQGH